MVRNASRKVTIASKRAALCLGAAFLALTSQAMAVGSPEQMRRDFQAQQNYIGWQQSQAAAAYVPTAEDAARDQIRANFEAAHREKIRKDATRDWWGVIVVSTDDGSWNVKLNAQDQTTPMMDAMDACKGTCSPVLTFANSCMAPAYSGQGGMYWSPGETREQANAAAVAACTAAGGTDCQSPPKEAFCSGWKYAYTGFERFSHRLELTATGKVAGPKLIEFPGAKDYIAKPLDRRGKSTAKMPVKVVSDDSVPWAGVNAEKRAQGVSRMAEPWTAIAVGGTVKAYAIHWGLNEQDASETAVSKCGAGDCKVLVAVPHGQCATAIRLHHPNGKVDSFGGHGKTVAEAEEQAMTACIMSGAKTCPVVFNECMM